MLDSLKKELGPGDAITIVFDGPTAQAAAGWSESWKEGFTCAFATHVEPTSLGHWGHPLRTKWQTKLQPQTTFILHADDDDVYHAGFADKLRGDCKDPTTLYIAKLRDIDKGRLIPRKPSIEFANIGTPCGIVPWALAGAGEWSIRLGGDMEYFKAVEQAAGPGKTVFLPHLIYEVNPK